VEPSGFPRDTPPMDWEPDAQARLKKAPFFVRPFIKARAEREATTRGLGTVTCALLDELKASEHEGS
jgi:hypothetical protein